MKILLSWTTVGGIAPALRGGAMAIAALSSVAAVGCGSQTLRLAAPETTPGIGYTCTSGTECYPASLAAPPEGQEVEAVMLTLPRECNGRIHEIVVREADSSSPQIDVTCAKQSATPPAATDGMALTQRR